jgi:Skp family chaperone for outer membrane proteins
MRTILFAAGSVLAVLSASVSAQEAAPAAAGPSCYIEVQRLMAEPPAGIGELGAAIRQLDASLRPQAEAINAIKAQIARLEERQNAADAPAVQNADFGEEGDSAPAAPPPLAGDPVAEEIRTLQADLDAKQAQLKLDYAAQQAAIVGPVQSKVSERAQAFAAQRHCAALKMARPPDLAALQTEGAQDVTGEFVAWYDAN